MGGIITLTTDFGLNDAYVAAMKGVILGINPEAKLIDICHTYAEGEGLLALIGSTGYLEVSLKGSSACTFLGARVGDEVRIR